MRDWVNASVYRDSKGRIYYALATMLGKVRVYCEDTERLAWVDEELFERATTFVESGFDWNYDDELVERELKRV